MNGANNYTNTILLSIALEKRQPYCQKTAAPLHMVPSCTSHHKTMRKSLKFYNIHIGMAANVSIYSNRIDPSTDEWHSCFKQGPSYSFLHEGAMGKPGDERRKPRPWRGSGGNPLDKFGTICSNLQVNLRWDVCTHPQKEQTSLSFPKATMESIASCFWCETSL